MGAAGLITCKQSWGVTSTFFFFLIKRKQGFLTESRGSALRLNFDGSHWRSLLRLQRGSLCYPGFANPGEMAHRGGFPLPLEGTLWGRRLKSWLQFNFCCQKGNRAETVEPSSSGGDWGLRPLLCSFPTQHQEKNAFLPCKAERGQFWSKFLELCTEVQRAVVFKFSFQVSTPFISVVWGLALGRNFEPKLQYLNISCSTFLLKAILLKHCY